MRSHAELIALSMRRQRAEAVPESHESEEQASTPALGLLRLQQQAGNRAVQRLVQRQTAPASAAPKGPPWPNGPTTERKRRSHTLAEYIGWVREVEQVYGPNRERVLQRLRMLYYSTRSGRAGALFDTVIDRQIGLSDIPMQSPPLSQATLDGLFETDFIVTPSGAQLDVSHLFAGLDVEVAGTRVKAGLGQLYYAARSQGIYWPGVLTWVGDLTSWFREWLSQKRKQSPTGEMTLGQQDRLLMSLANSKVSKDDLLGDMDAQAMARRYVETTTQPISDWQQGGPELVTSLTTSVSSMLEAFYDPQRSAPSQPLELNRFALFVQAANPRIPHQVLSTDPLRIRLAPNAKDVIHGYIYNTATLFLDQQPIADHSTEEILTSYDRILWSIAWYFVRFLSTGLETGDAPWP